MPAEPIEIPPPSPNDVLYETGDGYAIITLNRPVVLNAINWSIQRRLFAHLSSAEADPAIRAIIITGAGRAFSAGGDIQATPPDDDEPTPSGMEVNMKIWQMPKPVIAAVHGYAVGQGTELAAICDMTIASEDAVFGELQIRHGFAPPLLITPFVVGLKQAKEVLMLGERIDAPTALRMGMVNRVVPVESLMDESIDVARKLAALPEKAVKLNKLLVNRAYEVAGFSAALDYRADPSLAEYVGNSEPDPHLKVLRDQGWEAFRRSRDERYGEQESQGPGTA